MKIVSNKNKVGKFQQGGVVDPVTAQGSTPVPAEQSGDPMQILVEAAMAAVQNQDPNMAMEVCMMLLELVGATPAPVGAAQSGGNAPVFKRGGKIARYTSPLDKFRK